MKGKVKQFVSVLLIVFSFAGILGGCGSKAKPVENAVDKMPAKASGKITDQPLTLTYWVSMNAGVAQLFKNYGETELYKEYEKRTGVTINFIHPSGGSANEQFNTMLAADDLPDMIEYSWRFYAGGPEKAINDGKIVKLNELIDKYSPNLKKTLLANEDLNRQVKTDNGSYYVYPFIRGDESLTVFNGPIIRQDLLEDLGLKSPTTIDEWYTVLKAFKEKKNIECPLLFSNIFGDISTGNAFIGAYGIAYDFYQENGKIKFGPVEPGYKDFLITFQKWYAEKLIGQELMLQDAKTYDTLITSEKAGAFITTVGGGMGKYIPALRKNNSKAKLEGTVYPSLKQGESAKFGQRESIFPGNSGCVAISPRNKHQKETAQWLDYGYSPEGRMLFNFGIEGKSYKMVNGYPTYTEEITKNPENMPMVQIMSKYMRGHFNGPFVQAKEYFEQYMTYPEQLKAVEAWKKAGYQSKLPPYSFTPEENQKFNSIMNEVYKYSYTMFLRFIKGEEPMENFDQYASKMNAMGINEAVKMIQTAIERYNKR